MYTIPDIPIPVLSYKTYPNKDGGLYVFCILQEEEIVKPKQAKRRKKAISESD